MFPKDMMTISSNLSVCITTTTNWNEQNIFNLQSALMWNVVTHMLAEDNQNNKATHLAL